MAGWVSAIERERRLGEIFLSGGLQFNLPMATGEPCKGREKQSLTSLLAPMPTWKTVAILSTRSSLPWKKRVEATLYLSQSGSKQFFPSGGRWASHVCRRGPGTTRSVCGAGSSWGQKGEAELHLPGRRAQFCSPGCPLSHLRTGRAETDADQPQSTCWLTPSMGTIALALP